MKIIQEEYNELEQKYIRLLEVTNERSESHVKILLEEGQSRLNKSKLKNSSVSEQAQRLKSKLEGLDISSIKPNKDKDNSFKLSEVINWYFILFVEFPHFHSISIIKIDWVWGSLRLLKNNYSVNLTGVGIIRKSKI